MTTPGHISIRALDGGFLVAGDAAVVEEGALAVANPEYCMDIEEASKSLERLKRLWQPPLALLSRRLPGSLTFGKRQEVSW